MTLTDDHLDLLAETNYDVDATIRTVVNNADTIFTWDYEKGARPGLNKLYEKAKGAQWDGEKDLDWSIEVDQERNIREVGVTDRAGLAELGIDITGTPFERWSEKEWLKLDMETANWALSQFMHGEQGALVCTAKIVETVPWIDAKYYAATQVMDEARHVEVFAKYLDTKLSGWYPVNPHLQALLDDIINDHRWDMTYLGMQVMVEGLALAAFGNMMNQTVDPLLKKLLRYVMSDEARHVAFGVLSLQEYYAELTEAELFERQEFAYDAAIRMR
ncbi:MAG: ferritin-like domain-containing protein, partial [Actinomycetota bacterium]